jgi:hypothetical protein
MTRPRSKTLATWLALLGGGFGLHRFYLHGKTDVWGWLLPLPTLLGLYGVLRARHIGLDDQLSWALIPLLGLVLAGTMLSAIVYGLTSDEKWNARFNLQGSTEQRSGWLAIIGVLVALSLGATALMATIAFGAQRYFEFQAEPAALAQTNSRKPSQ